MTLIAILSLIVGLLGLAWGIFVTLRRRELSRAAFAVEAGIAPRLGRRRGPNRRRTTTLVYGGVYPLGTEYLVLVPVTIRNLGAIPIHDVCVQFQYPVRYAPPTEEQLRQEYGDAKFSGQASFLERRSFVAAPPIAVAAHEIPVLRPGEGIIIFEPLRYGQNPKETDLFDDSWSAGHIVKCLRRLPQFRNYCKVDVFVYSSNSSPASISLNVLWFAVDSLEALMEVVGKSVVAFWCGQFPSPGIYVKLPWERIPLRTEMAELYLPKLIQALKGRTKVSVMPNPMEAELATIELYMPSWNYYNPEETAKHAEFLKASRISGPLGKVLEGLRKLLGPRRSGR